MRIDNVVKKNNNIIYLVIIILLVFFPLLKVGLVTNDDLQLTIKASHLSFIDYLSYLFNTYRDAGRTGYFAAIAGYIPAATFIKSFAFYKFFCFVAILSNMYFLSIFIYKIFNSYKLFYLTFLVALLSFQNSWEHNPAVSFPGVFTISISILLCSFIFLINYLQGSKKRYLYLSIFMYVLTLFTYELFVFYSLCFFLIFFHYTKNIRVSLKKIIPYFIVTLLYITLYFMLQKVYGAGYSGVQVQEKLNIEAAIKVIWQLSISAIPSYFFFNEKYQYLMYIYSDVVGSNDIFSVFWNSIRVEWIIKAILVVVLLNKLICLEDNGLKFEKVTLIFFMIISVFYFFVPSLLLSITKHYQDAVLINNLLGMPATYFSYIAFVFGFVIIVYFLYGFLKNKYLKKAFLILISSIFIFVSFAVDFTNTYISKYQVMSQYKWITLDRFLKTNEFLSVPNGSTVYAPSLWTYIGSVAIHDDYWTDYVQIKTGKNIRFTRYVSDDDHKNNNFYFLKFSQEAKNPNQSIVFSKIKTFTKAQEDRYNFYSDSVYVFNYSQYEKYYIVGSYDAIEGRDSTEKSKKIFNKKLGSQDYSVVNEMRRSVIELPLINLESVIIINNSNNDIIF